MHGYPFIAIGMTEGNSISVLKIRNAIIINIAAAQPLKFLDFLIEKPVQGVILNGGGVLVNVPSPASFALHKLLVANERNVSMHDKTEKDLIQVAQVFELLIDERPGDLPLAWQEFIKRGRGWINRICPGLSEIKKHKPEVYSYLKKFLE